MYAKHLTKPLNGPIRSTAWLRDISLNSNCIVFIKLELLNKWKWLFFCSSFWDNYSDDFMLISVESLELARAVNWLEQQYQGGASLSSLFSAHTSRVWICDKRITQKFVCVLSKQFWSHSINMHYSSDR